MESVAEKRKKRDGPGSESESMSCDSLTESRESIRSTSSSDDSVSAAQLGWPIGNISNCLKSESTHELKKQGSKDSDMMKERFAKLLLGEDMSGSGKGVCPALTISNAITNLCATVFGQLWRLEPLPPEKKSMWQREMEWLLCVSDHIVELKPSWQTLPDGKRVEVMTCRPRSDLTINLPALRKLDNILLEILDGFTSTEFWYVDKGIVAAETDGSVSLQKAIQRQEGKWWLPVPRVPPGGLCEDARKELHFKGECANQILKAAKAINSLSLAEMEVPESYLETLPKNGRACLGDVVYRYITSEHFSADCLLDCLDLSSDHAALEMANRVEEAIYVWRRRQHPNPNHSTSKSSWEMVKDLMIHGDKRELLAGRAESLLISLKHRFPGLNQTTLDTTKIQCNKDVGKSILESYSRVLESLAFNIVARIDDLLYVDDVTKQSDKLSSAVHRTVAPATVTHAVPVSGTPYRSAYTTPRLSPAPAGSPARRERTPGPNGGCSKPPRRGLGVKRVLTNYLSGEAKVKSSPGSVTCRTAEGTTALSRLSMEGKD